jgi:hypothetical protein
MTDDTEFGRQRILKDLDHEHEEAMKRLENAWLRRRTAAEFTKDYSLFALRSLFVLNGGAIVAMLAFIGNFGANEGNELHCASVRYHLTRPICPRRFQRRGRARPLTG